MKLQCYLSLQVQSVAMLQCHLVKARRASYTAFVASHRLPSHCTGRSWAITIKHECSRYTRLCIPYVALTLYWAFPVFCHQTSTLFILQVAPRTLLRVSCVTAIRHERCSNIAFLASHGLLRALHWTGHIFTTIKHQCRNDNGSCTNMNVVITVLGGPRNTL